jgi:hypothetical protein
MATDSGRFNATICTVTVRINTEIVELLAEELIDQIEDQVLEAIENSFATDNPEKLN